MIFPTDDEELAKRVTYLVDCCLSTREEREQLYQWREKYYLFGTNGYEKAPINKLESHIDLVTSFLYAPDHAFYHISSDFSDDDLAVLKTIALQDDFNDDFQSCGLSSAIMEAIPWSIVYDTMIPKVGWNRDREELFLELVPPHNFGVYREGVSDLDSQSCFAHTYLMEYQQAAGKLILAGHGDKIPYMKVQHSDALSPFPEMLQRMIIAGSTGSSLTGTLFGQVNPDFAPHATYQSKTSAPLVRFSELWAWDDTFLDYRVFHLIEPNILIGDSVKTIAAYKKATKNVLDFFGRLEKMGMKLSDSNPFLPGEHPFSKLQPYGKYNYFWGKAHIDTLIPLQDKLLNRLDQIDDILDRQADPAKVASGFLGLTEEKIAAFGGSGSYLQDQLPTAKVQELKPDMPPDLFHEYEKFEAMFLEASGLTEVISGRSEKGVRSHQQADGLKKSGSGRIKKAAITIEEPIVKIGDVALRLKMAHDKDKLKTGPDESDKTHDFYPCEVGSVKMRVDGHSHSPLFGDESRELAIVYRKFGTIDDEDFIRMTNPPSRDTLLHSLRKRRKQQKQMLQQHPEAAAKMLAGGQHGGKKK
jgi:hypothetical protein